MKNFSSITENLDITTKKYVDDNKVTSVDGLSGGTLTSPLKISGGDQSTASKISLNQSANGQITDSSTSTLFGFMSSTTLTVGGNGYALALRGSGIRPTYKGTDLALYSDIPTVPDISGLMPKSGGTFTGNIAVPKTITFTDETNPFIKMRTGNTDFYFQSTSGQFGLGPTWDKATHWDSNGNVTFPTVPKVRSSSLALETDIPTFELSGTSLTITI